MSGICESIAAAKEERQEIMAAISGPYGYEVGCLSLNYEFMRWKFVDSPPLPGIREHGILVLRKTIINPEPPGADSSYHMYGIPPRSFTRERAAAWLIAHWWEHALKMCECQTPEADAKGSTFRYVMMDALLAYSDSR